MAFLLVGDTVQLPLVQEDAKCFNNAKNQNDVNGHHLLFLFDTLVELEENMIFDQKYRHAV